MTVRKGTSLGAGLGLVFGMVLTESGDTVPQIVQGLVLLAVVGAASGWAAATACGSLPRSLRRAPLGIVTGALMGGATSTDMVAPYLAFFGSRNGFWILSVIFSAMYTSGSGALIGAVVALAK